MSESLTTSAQQQQQVQLSNQQQQQQPNHQPKQQQQQGQSPISTFSQKAKETPRGNAIRNAKAAAGIQRVRNQTPSTPGSPGAALVAMPPRKPGAALLVMPPLKRSKLDADSKEDNVSNVKDPSFKVSNFLLALTFSGS